MIIESNSQKTFSAIVLVPVVQTLDSAIHWINHYPLDNSIGFASVYPLDSDLSGGQRYPSFEQLGPVHQHGCRDVTFRFSIQIT